MADDFGQNGSRYSDQRERLENRLTRIEQRLGESEKWQARRDVEIGALKIAFDKHMEATAEDARRSAQDARETLNAVTGLKGEISEIQAQRGMISQETLFKVIAATAALVTITGGVVAFVVKVSA